MKKVFLLFICFIYFASLKVIAVSWVQIDDNNYIDKDSVQIYKNDSGGYDFNKKIFWVKYNGNKIYKDIEKIKNVKVEYGLSQYIVDYSKHMMSIKSGLTYDKYNHVITSYTYCDYELRWESIVPNSNGELWADLVKKPRILKRIYKAQCSERINK